MEVLIFLAIAAILYGAGYATRGFIGREVKALGAAYVADRTVLIKEFDVHRAALIADVKAELAKLKTETTAAVNKL